jgi:DNA-binding MarR family transcriptional regulator
MPAQIHTIESATLADRLRPVLLRLARELRREARAAGVSASQVALLSTIQKTPGIGVNELAERERMSPPAMSTHVDGLVRAGQVVRTTNEHDRRRIELTLTDDGRRLLRRVRSRRTVWLAQRLDKLSQRDLAAIDAAIDPLGLLLDGEERA